MNISIVTPIYNRSQWLPLMIINLKNLDYPKDKLEWVILDTKDGDSNIKLFENYHQIKEVEKEIGFPIKYTYEHHKMTIGAKRNKLTKLASHKICANMDSDDYYFPTWLSHSMDVMNSDPKCTLVGTKGMVFVFPKDNFKITGIECYDKRMIHESGMLYTKKHHRSMGGFKKSSQGEGVGMIDFNENKCLCTDAEKVIVCICHNGNTIPKDRFIDKDIGADPMGGPIADVIRKILGIPDFKLLNYQFKT